MPDNEKGNTSVQKKDTAGQKRKASDSSRAKGTPEHNEAKVVVENGAIIGASPPQGEGSSSAVLSAIQEGLTQMSGTLANAITEAFKSLKDDLEISYGEGQEEDLLGSDHEGEPPAKKKREDANDNSQKNMDVDASVGQLLDRSNTTSNEGKIKVLSSLKQDLQKEETGPKVDTELASIIDTLIKDGLPEEKLQDKMNKYHRPENCESLTKVRVNQAVWDNLSPSVRSQDVRMQKVQTSLFKGMCALTGMINKLVEQIPTFPAGNELLQEATDAFALFANANTELNHRRRGFIKPDLHNDYKHLCSSSLAITDQLFGDDLPKQVKDLTEVNRVGKKVTTHSGSFSRSHFDSRNSRNYMPHSSSRGRGYRQARRPFLGFRYNDRQTNPPSQRKTKQGKSK